MDFINTRNTSESLQSANAILQGLAENGGLFVPHEIPSSEIFDMSKMDYVEHALWVLGQFFTDFTTDELRQCVESAYSISNFDTPEIAPVAQARTSETSENAEETEETEETMESPEGPMENQEEYLEENPENAGHGAQD